MRLVLIRHYKTRFNVSGHVMGWGDSARDETSQQDLEYLESVFERREVAFDSIYSSALERSRQTAAYFSRSFKVAQSRVAAELNEINYGDLYGKPKKWVIEHCPQYKNDPDFVYPQGESFSQMQARSVDCVCAMADACAGQVVLAVIHAGVARALVSHFLGLDYAGQLKRKVSHRYIGVLDFDGARCSAYEEWGESSGFISDLGLTQPLAIT